MLWPTAFGLFLSVSVPPEAPRRDPNHPYTPASVQCPPEALIRPADNLNYHESTYVGERSKKASGYLRTWLHDVWGSQYAGSEGLPKLSLALSGGGTKAGLTTAGVMHALDDREDGNSSTKGLLQSMTYISALSGGSLTLSGIMANDFAKVSELKEALYDQTYQNPFGRGQNFSKVLMAAGYPTTLLDIYGRAIGYNYIETGATGNSGLLWSNVTSQPSFHDHDAPFPIITMTQANVEANECKPNKKGAIWETSPLEFGSWDTNVDAFYPTKYMGSTSAQGRMNCTVGFDNVGFITAASANILANPANCTTGNSSKESLGALAGAVDIYFPNADVLLNPYPIIPNPFHESRQAGNIRSQKNLYGDDGGHTGQSIPIFPWLQPERGVDVIVAVDAQTRGPDNTSNGTATYNTYLSAKEKGYTKMPLIPTPSEYKAYNLSSRAQFFGCHDKNVSTIIYLPSNQASKVSNKDYMFSPEQIDDLYQGGIDMVTQGGDGEWPKCLACGIMHKKAKELPECCKGCLDKYCWK